MTGVDRNKQETRYGHYRIVLLRSLRLFALWYDRVNVLFGTLLIPRSWPRAMQNEEQFFWETYLIWQDIVLFRSFSLSLSNKIHNKEVLGVQLWHGCIRSYLDMIIIKQIIQLKERRFVFYLFLSAVKVSSFSSYVVTCRIRQIQF